MSCGVSGVFVLSSQGEPLVERLFRDDVAVTCASTFRLILQDKDMRSPINVTRDATFFHIRADKLVLMCATNGNPSAVMVFEYLCTWSALGPLAFACDALTLARRRNGPDVPRVFWRSQSDEHSSQQLRRV